MFPTFTGNSRRARNVNLSGQRTTNPFTSTWAPATNVGASKTVAHAQAERQQRQHERDRLKAAQRIQKTWRGHRVRQGLKAARRQKLDQLYNTLDPELRIAQALPLLLAVYDAARPDDRPRLLWVAEDLLKSESDAASTPAQAQLLLDSLGAIMKIRPQAIEPVIGRYYRVLGRACHDIGPASQSPELVRGVVAPLLATQVPESFTKAAYHAFAHSFLTLHDLAFFESNVAAFATGVDQDRLYSSLLAAPPAEPKTYESQADFLWLLAHLIALQDAKKQEVSSPLYLKALYLLLSMSSTYIRTAFRMPDPKGSSEARDVEGGLQQTLPLYVSDKLPSLIGKDEISTLLEMFTMNHGAKSASEMRLYLADMSTQYGPLPALKFFWNATSRTSIFSTIASNGESTLDVLRQRPSGAGSSTAKEDSLWHREWRTILLFLELYVFILRLTDDDDFFSGLNPQSAVQGSPSRLRSSSLSMEELKRLTRFLKHLSFTLYYSATELLETAARTPLTLSSPVEFLASPSRRMDSADVDVASKTASFSITAGIEFEAFRTLVTAAMKMVYERDSRRPFLPKGHWLMTSNLDMGGFVEGVVNEDQRQREARESREEEDEDSDEDMDPNEPNYTFAGQTRNRHAQVEKWKAVRRKEARERMLASIGPRLEILRNMPFVVPFEVRVQIFRQFHNGNPFSQNMQSVNVLARHQAKITRGHIFTDALTKFWDLDDGLKEPIQIQFVDEFGMEEAGIDGGGVTKEFLTSVTKEAFTNDERLFVTNSQNSYYPNPCAIDQQAESLRAAQITENSETWNESMADLLRQYEFLGRIIGKCMYEGILIDIVFAGFFLLKWASARADNYRPSINDLHDLDEELYQGMLQLKNYPGDIKDLDLDFTINDQVSLPGAPVRTVTRNLVPNGDRIPVTNENRPLYISYVARHRLVVQSRAQTRAFLRGLGMIIDPTWLSMFNQSELQRLVGGDNSEIDVEDLRRHTVYGGVYVIGDDGEEHPTVKLFWDVLHSLDDAERRLVLKYVTSTPRAPLLGFSQLSPAFSIRDGGQEVDRLPSASTCMNLLKLPQYRTAESLREKLLYAVKSGAGFDLS
ncbi:hypothetical protein B0H63DRAFT_530011 [Podospora didyma]|uniref:HECT-type E3 ubiquitin transferase n=1 Tax=Podospora didyma TaxID=330526 RepID=A0AAE0JWR8_9PEZI|nr:hypothetical protein B0H63DRAFT_530011 [Podospora didyma]